MSLIQSSTSQLGWGFTPCETVLTGGISVFVPELLGCRDMEGILTGDATLSSPGTAGPRRCPAKQLSPRAGSMSPSQLARLFMAGNIRDGTGRYCFDMCGGKNSRRDGTGRKIMKIIVAWMGRDRTVGVNILDGTGRYSTTTFSFHDGTGR